MTNDPFLRPGPAGRSLEQASPYPPPPTNPQEEPSAGAVREYDPRWPTQFATERALLRELLQPWLTTDIEHVGSTAVPGLPAKPCIDMLAGVADLEQARAAGEVLRHHGYHYRVHRPEAHLFEKPGVGDWRRHTHHLHLTEPGSDLWNERVTFRDALGPTLRLPRSTASGNTPTQPTTPTQLTRTTKRSGHSSPAFWLNKACSCRRTVYGWPA